MGRRKATAKRGSGSVGRRRGSRQHEMGNPQRGEQAEERQADDVVFVELGHAALFHGKGGLRTQAPQLQKASPQRRPNNLSSSQVSRLGLGVGGAGAVGGGAGRPPIGAGKAATMAGPLPA